MLLIIMILRMYFEIENNSMVNTVVKYQYLHGLHTDSSYISQDNEILSIFFKNYDIIVKWINCNYTWGWYDVDMGKWTGAVGQVNMDDQIR